MLRRCPADQEFARLVVLHARKSDPVWHHSWHHPERNPQQRRATASEIIGLS